MRNRGSLFEKSQVYLCESRLVIASELGWELCSPLSAPGPHLVQTHRGAAHAPVAVQAASVSVSSYGLCSVALEGLVLLVSSVPLALTLSLPPLLEGFLTLRGRELMETSLLGLGVARSLTLCTLSSCRLLYVCPSTAGGIIFDDGWAGHWSMHLAKCYESLHWYSH